MGYGNPRTLSDQSVRRCLGDIRAFKPSVMVGVPAEWESIKKGIINKVGAPGSLKSNIFWGAMAAKQSLLYLGLPGTNVLDRLVFSKIKEAIGGNLRLMLNGGGSIAEGTARFISFAICPILPKLLGRLMAWFSASPYRVSLLFPIPYSSTSQGMIANGINDPMAWASANPRLHARLD